MPTPPVPGQPHPDVATIKAVLAEMTPGGELSYEEAAKCLQLSGSDPVFRRRADAARKQLVKPEEGGIVIVCVNGIGFLRELPGQTKERVSGRETRALRRKASKNVKHLSTIDVSAIPAAERPELYALMVINRAIQITAGKRSQIKLIAASTAVSRELTVSRALEVLQDREKSNGD